MRLVLALLALTTGLPAMAQNTVSDARYVELQQARKDDPSWRTSDPAQLAYYADDNAATPPPKPGAPPRVVFFGDSITHNWGNKHYSTLFQRKPNYFNRGIGGQTTWQMLLRYHADVLALHPEVVVFLGGANDLSSLKLPDPVAFIESNIASIAELALLHHEHIILCSVLPVSDAVNPRTKSHDPDKILALNAWLKSFADEHHVPYVDYYAALTDGHDRMKPELTADGLHPNAAGMALMEPLVEAAIAKDTKR